MRVNPPSSLFDRFALAQFVRAHLSAKFFLISVGMFGVAGALLVLIGTTDSVS